MKHHTTDGRNGAAGQCFVCEGPIVGGDWYAQVKHGEWTVHLCRPKCARAFYARRLPKLRCLIVLAAAQSVPWQALRPVA